MQIIGHSQNFVYPSKGWKITAEDLEKSFMEMGLFDKPHMIIFNNPNNPTGCHYTKAEVKSLAEVFKKYNTVVFADDIYADLVHKKH